MRSRAFLYLARYSSLTKCAAGLTLKGWLEGENLKSMILEDGGQQLVGFTPAGRSGGPHVFRSGGDIGAAKAKGLLLLRVTAPQSPPRPSRTFLLCPTICGGSPWELGFGVGLFWFPLHVILGI